tara:strand:+ start:605 stop:850 length:246 start_codon:yes stop_codon:yes gene_type:complete
MLVKYFAWIRDLTKKETEDLSNSNVNDIEQLKKYLINNYPKLKKHIEDDILRYAINQKYVTNNVKIKHNDEIAIIPPVSGG